MPLDNIIISLLPVPVFYLIYYRYFTFKPVYSKHFQAFLTGIAFAIFIAIISSYLLIEIKFRNPLLTGFLKAALIEKAGAFLLILFILKHYPNFSIMEGTLSAMMFGIGFSLVENVFYAGQFGFSVILLRIIFSVPLHLTTCGIMGYYLSMKKMSSSLTFKTSFALKAFFLPFFLHGIFDTLLIAGRGQSYLASPLLIIMVFILEFMLSRSQTITPHKSLTTQNLRFEEWLTMDREPRYERWILQSMGTPSIQQVHLFLWRPGFIRFFLVIGFMAFAIFGLSYRIQIMEALNIILRVEEQIIFLGIFPMSISIIIILVGAINPNFFQKSMITIPIISDVEIYINDNFEEMQVTYSLSSANCFLRSSEKFGLGTRINVRFECPSFSSDIISGEVVWENHSDKQYATGTIIKLDKARWSFFRFLFRYHLFRIRKGLYFFLRLPGSETTRKLFMRPISTMQDERLLKSGTIIFHEFEEGKEFYLLKKGKILFYKNKNTGGIITMETIDSGTIFGEMSVIAGTPRAASAICITDCIVAVADSENMDALIANNAEFSRSLVQALVERIKMSEKILVDQINSLEKEKLNSQKYFHSSMMILIIGLGYNPAKAGAGSKLDMKKLSTVLQNMDDEVAGELMNLVIQRQEALTSENPEKADDMLEKTINQLYEKLA